MVARSVVADCLEGNVAVLVIRDGLNGRAFRLVTLVQSEREVAPCELTAREVLLRLERYRGPLRVVRVREGRDIVLAVIGDGRLRLVALRLHRDVNLHHLGVVSDSRIGTDVLLLEHVVVLADGQTGEGKIDLALLVVLDGLDGITRGRVALVQAEGERAARQRLAREGLRRLDGCTGRRLRVGEGRHGLIAAVGGDRL